jgi:hypothetical protein
MTVGGPCWFAHHVLCFSWLRIAGEQDVISKGLARRARCGETSRMSISYAVNPDMKIDRYSGTYSRERGAGMYLP